MISGPPGQATGPPRSGAGVGVGNVRGNVVTEHRCFALGINKSN